MTSPRGALIAVCGIGAGARTADVSRLLAAELTRRSPRGAVLLTAAHGPAASSSLEPALHRHPIVVADVGALLECGEVISIAAVAICTFRIDADLVEVAARLHRAAMSAHRTVAVATAVADSDRDDRRVAAALPRSVRALTLLPSACDAAPPTEPTPTITALVGALA